MRLPIRFASRMPSLLGLPLLLRNDAEGFVLKPCDAAPTDLRPIVKHKIPEFDDRRFDESQAFDSEIHLPLNQLLDVARAMMNRPRIESARSKVGTVPDAVIEEAVLDAWIDLEDLFPRRMTSLGPDEEDALRNLSTTAAEQLMEVSSASQR